MAGKRWKRGSKKYCLVVALDIKNAFNSARWDTICLTLDGSRVPDYLKRMVKSYLSARSLVYDTKKGPHEYKVTGGVPQGSVLGPLLWNIIYDGLLKLKLPTGAELTAFADDVMITVTAKFLEGIHRIWEDTYDRIQGWMSTAGLKLAEHKTAVLITSRKRVEKIEFTVGKATITSQPCIRYLGVVLDTRLNFKRQTECATQKAAKAASALARLMPNVGGPRQNKRRLLTSVVTSILTYAIPIWGDALRIKECHKIVSAIYRLSALRVSSAFRTVSKDAINVIAGMMPIQMLAKERKTLYDQRSAPPKLKEEQRR